MNNCRFAIFMQVLQPSAIQAIVNLRYCDIPQTQNKLIMFLSRPNYIVRGLQNDVIANYL